jgi:prolyl oligopeptidase
VSLPHPTYPSARRDSTADTHHGVRVEDPYRWLEESDSPDTMGWTEAQNALTRAVLDGPGREQLRAEFERLYDYPRTSAPVPRGARYFFTRNSGLQNQPVLYVQDGWDASPRILLDPNTLSADGTSALTGWEPSSDGAYLAYAVSQGGSDWQEVRVRDVERGVDLDDALTRAKFVTISWLADSSGFFYTRFPPEGNYHPAVCLHHLGRPQQEDDVVFPATEDPEIVYEVDQSSDHRFHVVTAFKGASENSRINIFPAFAEGVYELGARFEHAWHFIDAAADTVYVRTNWKAPRGRIVAVDASGVREVVPESEGSLVDATLVGGRLVAVYLDNASSRVRFFHLDGTAAGDAALPALGSVTDVSGEAEGEEVFFRFVSFTWPPTILCYSLATGSLRTFAAGATHVRSEHYDTTQVWYPSRDGTRVSMFLVSRKGVPRGAARPAWLTAYGGFNINIVPEFDPAHVLWLDRGGLLAVPNLRGGGEYGEEWHKAGTLERKQNVFDDCISAIEYLIAEQHTAAGRIVLEGGSNGGLLVSAVLTQRPDLPGAVVCRVPVADMLRYHLFTIGRFWVPEYGSADDAAQFAFLHAYSPLHRIRDDVRYPPVLITTAETDDRVHPGMARKLAARLQAACAASRSGPALIRIERRAGHGVGKPVAKMIDEDADIYTFALNALDFRPEPQSPDLQ